MGPYMYMYMLITVCLLCANGGLTEGKISDACHGIPELNQTYNILECDPGLTICISNVTYYMWGGQQSGCNFAIEEFVNPKCCQHVPSRCSWQNQTINEAAVFQKNCTGQSVCDLHSPRSVKIDRLQCLPQPFAHFSSVRSINYTCQPADTACAAEAVITPKSNPAISTPTPESAAISTPTPEQAVISTPTPEPAAISTPTPEPAVISTPKPEPVLTRRTKLVTSPSNSTSPITTKLPANPTGTTSASPTVWYIVGGVGAAVVCLIVVLVLIYIWRRRTRPVTFSSTDQKSANKDKGPSTNGGTCTTTTEEMTQEQSGYEMPAVAELENGLKPEFQAHKDVSSSTSTVDAPVKNHIMSPNGLPQTQLPLPPLSTPDHALGQKQQGVPDRMSPDIARNLGSLVNGQNSGNAYELDPSEGVYSDVTQYGDADYLTPVSAYDHVTPSMVNTEIDYTQLASYDHIRHSAQGTGADYTQLNELTSYGHIRHSAQGMETDYTQLTSYDDIRHSTLGMEAEYIQLS